MVYTFQAAGRMTAALVFFALVLRGWPRQAEHSRRVSPVRAIGAWLHAGEDTSIRVENMPAALLDGRLSSFCRRASLPGGRPTLNQSLTPIAESGTRNRTYFIKEET